MADGARADSRSEPARALAAFGDFGAARIEPLRKGLIHQTWAIENAGSEFILQRVSEIFSPDIHRNIARVGHHLSARGIETIRLLPTLDGEQSARLPDGHRWRLMPRIPGVSFDRCESSGQARAAGALVAGFHSALADFHEPLEPLGFAFHEPRLHIAELQGALRAHPGHRLYSDVERLARDILPAWERWMPPESLPLRVIHGDLKFNNVLFEAAQGAGREHPIALIDLDTLARMPLCFDWGDAWRSWCNARPEDDPQAELDLSIFRAASEGLMSGLEIEIGESELESLEWGLELLSLEVCTRFAADALEETHFGHDPQRYAGAGEHNLCRARGQLSLHLQARETHDERRRFLRG